MRRHNAPHYRQNRPAHRENGRKVQDEVCGAWTYENRLVTDEEGQRVDPAFKTYDNASGRDAEGVR